MQTYIRDSLDEALDTVQRQAKKEFSLITLSPEANGKYRVVVLGGYAAV